MTFILSVLAIFVLLLVSELWWRKRSKHGEISRKFVHITVGSFVAFWPYLLTPNQIKLLSVAFMAVVIISRYFKVFQAIHSVQRPTYGEFWFALVVGLLTLVLDHPHIYTAALLTMALADGLAAIIGTRYGAATRYTVFSSHKSVIGTATFFVVTVGILAGYALLTPGMLPLLTLVAIAAGATVLENIATHGFDNLVVPMFVAVTLAVLA